MSVPAHTTIPPHGVPCRRCGQLQTPRPLTIAPVPGRNPFRPGRLFRPALRDNHRRSGESGGVAGELDERYPQALSTDGERLQVACDGAALGGRPGRVVRDHPRGLPVAGEHDVGGRRAPARELRGKPDPS